MSGGVRSRVPAIIPVQWPIKAIPKLARLTVANQPVLLIGANPKRTFYAIGNTALTYTVGSNVINYTVFETLFFSFDKPLGSGAGLIGLPILPGGLEISSYGAVPQQDIWVWSAFSGGATPPINVLGYEGINDPDFDPSNLMT